MFTCEVPGGAKVKLADLSIGVIGDAAREGELGWVDVYQAPLRDDRAAQALYRACCAHAEVDPPETLTPGVLIEAFSLDVKDDLPTTFQDGLPKEAGEATKP
jgi:hypothetical protein